MSSLTGLTSGFFTDIDVIDTIAINGNIGTANQVLKSDGSQTSWADTPTPPTSDIITAGTGISITSSGNPESVSSNVKSLVLSGTAVTSTPQTFNPNANGGSQTITISDTNTEYTANSGVEISGSNVITATIDEDTIVLDGADLSVAKVPEQLTAGTNVSFSSGTTYDGSTAITVSSTNTNTTYSAGDNLTLGGTTFNLDTTIEDQVSLEFLDNGSATNITGSDYPSKPTVATYLDLSSSTNILPSPAETLKSISFVDNTSQNYNLIGSSANEWVFSGAQTSGSDKLEVDFTATGTHGYLEFGFYANSYNPGIVFNIGVGVGTGGTSPFSTTLTGSAVAIDAYKIGLFDGSTTTYSLKEVLDFDGYENIYITSTYFFNNLTVGTRYRMSIYGRVYSSGNIYINSGGKNTNGLATRSFHQPTYLKFYEYDNSIGGSRN